MNTGPDEDKEADLDAAYGVDPPIDPNDPAEQSNEPDQNQTEDDADE